MCAFALSRGNFKYHGKKLANVITVPIQSKSPTLTVILDVLIFYPANQNSRVKYAIFANFI